MKNGELPQWFEKMTRELSGKPFPGLLEGFGSTDYLDALIKGNVFEDIEWDT